MRCIALAVLLVFAVAFGAKAQTPPGPAERPVSTPDRIDIRAYGAKCDGRLLPVTANGRQLSQLWHGFFYKPDAPKPPGWVAQPLFYYSGSDDTPAIGAALAVALAQNKPLYIPGSRAGEGADTGYCLMRSGNPLGQDGTHGPAITGPLTIIGDGQDASRLVQFADNPGGSVSGVANPGAGYAVGDIVNVPDAGASPKPGLKLEVVAVNGSGGATDVISVGDPSFTTIPGKDAATTTSCTGQPACSGHGSGLTVNVVSGGNAITSPRTLDFASRIHGVTLRNFSLIATGQQNYGQALVCGDPVVLWSVNDIVADGIGIDYSRCVSLASRQSENTVITRSRIRWSARDIINVSSSRVVVANNILEHGGDDSIATPDQPSESGAGPFREGVVITGNFITDAGGIDVLGGAGVSITGNTLVRMKAMGITVSSSFFGNDEGSTPSRSIVVSGNSITDVFNVLHDPIFGGSVNRCIQIGSVEPIAGRNGRGTAGIGVPGFASTSTPGAIVSPYEVNIGGQMTWPMLVNGNEKGLSEAPTAPGLGMIVANNSCVRTLPIDSTEMFSSLGLGATYGAAGWLDFALNPDFAWGTVCIDTRFGTIVNARFDGNICSGAKWGFQIQGQPDAKPPVTPHLYDAMVEDNTFRDLRGFGIAMSTAPPGQRIVFQNNTWDLDPYFSSPNRAVASVKRGASFTGSIAGNLLTVAGPVKGTILPGQRVVGGHAPNGAVIQAYMTCPPGEAGCHGGGTGADGVYTLSVPAPSPTGSEAMTSGQAIYTGGWVPGSPNLPNFLGGLPSQGIQFLFNRLVNAPYIGTIGPNNRQLGNQFYASINAEGKTAGVGGGAFYDAAFPALAAGWEQIHQDSDPRSATYGQTIAPTTGGLTAGADTPSDVALTGAPYRVPPNVGLLRARQTGTVAAQTITLPTPVADAQSLEIDIYGAIHALTFSPAVAGFSAGSPVAANSRLHLTWDKATDTWHRLQ